MVHLSGEARKMNHIPFFRTSEASVLQKKTATKQSKAAVFILTSKILNFFCNDFFDF
ncbi:MAG: hypothetical protein U5L45_15185 [Saprospiraceae bacterium]|nr:hypothetical protein [Saprospiraceae bacterium]